MKPDAPTPHALLRLLAEPDRLRAYAAVVLGAGSPAAVAERTGLPARTVMAALRRLEQGGLVETVEGKVVADTTAFKETIRRYEPEPAEQEPLDPDRQRAAILRTFIVDGRLTQVPVARGKRRIVLEHLVAAFEPGVRYPEGEVNAVLRAWHPDHAALRRYLVDEELMTRDRGVYWRSDGSVEV